MEFQAVEYPNEQDCQDALVAILSHSNAVANSWGYILGVDGKCIIVIDERISNFDFTPNEIKTFNKSNLNYFPIIEEDDL